MNRTPPQTIVIAGGGVAAIEAVAALRALAGPLPRITLLAPEGQLNPRPASVAAPFGFGVPNPLPFELIRRHAAFELRPFECRLVRNGHVFLLHRAPAALLRLWRSAARGAWLRNSTLP